MKKAFITRKDEHLYYPFFKLSFESAALAPIIALEWGQALNK